MTDIASTIKFRVICGILKDIKNADTKSSKDTIIDQYYKSFCKHRLQFRKSQQLSNSFSPENGESSFYCVLRCLIPSCDKARPSYRLQIPTLGKVYLQILQIASHSREAEILLGCRYTPVGGDYAEKVYRILKPRCRTEMSAMSLQEVHQLLDRISSGNRTDTEKVIAEVSERMSAMEQMWFIRLLLKTMSLGISDASVLGILHPKAGDFMKSCQNLQLLCNRLANGEIDGVKSKDYDSLEKKNDSSQSLPAVLFEHIQPQLCEIFPGQIERLMKNDVLHLETKMDGERFHLHYGGKRFKYFSRKGVDYTSSFGDSFDTTINSFSSRLRDLITDDLESFILDGEMMIWDVKRHCFHEKSENTDVKSLQRNASGTTWVPCFIVYDLLYLNGVSLLHLPYLHRRSKLRALMKEKDGVLHIMKSTKIKCAEEFQELFQAALDNQDEGVVLKSQMSVYHPGKRNGGGWFKVKADGLTTEFDLLVMGGFYNRTRTYIESFLLGVLDYTNDDHYAVWSVGKVSNILKQRDSLNAALCNSWRLLSEEKPPMWFHYIHQNADGRPDVWIPPNESVILQIKSTDLHPSCSFALRTALHFPRIMMWRPDKPWNECCSLTEFNTIERNSKGHGVEKIVNRSVTLDDLIQPRKKSKPLSKAQKRKLSLFCYERKIDETKISISSSVLSGFSVCVISGSKERKISEQDIKELVLSHGGKVIENPIPNCSNCIMVAGDSNYRLNILIKSQQYNIARLEWLLDYCDSKRNDLRPSDLIVMTSTLRDNFQDYYEQLYDDN